MEVGSFQVFKHRRPDFYQLSLQVFKHIVLLCSLLFSSLESCTLEKVKIFSWLAIKNKNHLEEFVMSSLTVVLLGNMETAEKSMWS